MQARYICRHGSTWLNGSGSVTCASMNSPAGPPRLPRTAPTPCHGQRAAKGRGRAARAGAGSAGRCGGRARAGRGGTLRSRGRQHRALPDQSSRSRPVLTQSGYEPNTRATRARWAPARAGRSTPRPDTRVGKGAQCSLSVLPGREQTARRQAALPFDRGGGAEPRHSP
jgi:hypothetical protein